MMRSDVANLAFAELVRFQVVVFDSVLAELGAPSIFQNPDISFDPYWCNERYLKFELSGSNCNSVSLTFHLMADGMRIDFQSYDEAKEYSENQIKERRDEIVSMLRRLLGGHILVEYKGTAQYVNLFNDDGSRYGIWTLGSLVAWMTRGYWKSQSIDQHLFDPVYPPRST